MRIVVTGASGFIGSRLVSALAARGHEVEGVARSGGPPAVTLRVGSYVDTPSADVLVHLAECNRRDAPLEELAHAETTMAALVRKPYRRILYASSAAVYGDAWDSPHRADEEVAPRDTYTAVKLACEAHVVAAGGCVARLTNVYGPGMSPGTVVSAILDQAPGSGPLRVADETPVRDFLWIDDAVSALVAMTESSQPGVFNVATGTAVSVGEMARLALSLTGSPEREVLGKRPAGRPSTIRLDVEPMRVRFNWQATVSVVEGLNVMLRNAARAAR